MALVLGIPNGTLSEVHELLKSGGQVTRPQVVDLAGLDTLVALNRVRYVDVGTTIPILQRNGTIAFPFGTIAAAVASLPTGGVILIVPGAYTEPNITIPAACPITLANVGVRPAGVVGGNVTLSNSVLSSSELTAIGINFQNAALSSLRVNLSSCLVTNYNSGTGESRIVDCQIVNCTSTGTVVMHNCTVTNTLNLATAELWGCAVNGLTASGALTIRNSTVNAAASVGGNANAWKTRFGLSLTVTGNLVSDYDSLGGIIGALTFGSFTLAYGTPKITLQVVVPAVAAGAVGYVSTSLVGTGLQGLVPAGSLLVANPAVDLVAAGAGGGFINVRCDAANSARFAFLGPLAGGPENFLVGVI